MYKLLEKICFKFSALASFLTFLKVFFWCGNFIQRYDLFLFVHSRKCNFFYLFPNSDNYAFVTFFETSSAAEAIESECCEKFSILLASFFSLAFVWLEVMRKISYFTIIFSSGGNEDSRLPVLDLCFGGRRKFCGGSYVDFGEYLLSFSMHVILQCLSPVPYLFNPLDWLFKQVLAVV